MVVLKPGRSDVIRTRRHPWIYSGAVLSASEEAIRGDLVPVAEATKGERIVLGICEDKNYRTILEDDCGTS